jgi:hypothetical protein
MEYLIMRKIKVGGVLVWRYLAQCQEDCLYGLGLRGAYTKTTERAMRFRDTQRADFIASSFAKVRETKIVSVRDAAPEL